MKVFVKIMYEESYVPNRCKNPRFTAKQETVTANIRDLTMSDVSLAYDDISFEGRGKIYKYKDKLYFQVKMPNKEILDDLKLRGRKVNNTLEYLADCLYFGSRYYRTDFDRKYHNLPTDKESVMKQIKDDMKKYVVIDGVLFEECAKPRYCIYTFGCGRGDGTSLSVDYRYNPNIRKDFYFKAEDGDIAVKTAVKIAKERLDNYCADRIEKSGKLIIVY